VRLEADLRTAVIDIAAPPAPGRSAPCAPRVKMLGQRVCCRLARDSAIGIGAPHCRKTRTMERLRRPRSTARGRPPTCCVRLRVTGDMREGESC